MEPKNRAKICEGYVSNTEKIRSLRKTFLADVDHPVNVAEVAVGLAMTDLKPSDEGFGRRVAELFAQGVLDGGWVEAMESFIEETTMKAGQGGAAGNLQPSSIQDPSPMV